MASKQRQKTMSKNTSKQLFYGMLNFQSFVYVSKVETVHLSVE